MEVLPMFVENIRRIKRGAQTTTLRSFKRDYAIGQVLRLEGTDTYVQITDREQIILPDGLTPEIARGEGYKSVEEMVGSLAAHHRDMVRPRWLYRFTLVAKPAGSTQGEKPEQARTRVSDGLFSAPPPARKR